MTLFCVWFSINGLSFEKRLKFPVKRRTHAALMACCDPRADWSSSHLLYYAINFAAVRGLASRNARSLQSPLIILRLNKIANLRQRHHRKVGWGPSPSKTRLVLQFYATIKIKQFPQIQASAQVLTEQKVHKNAR